MPKKSFARLPVISFHAVLYSKKWEECVVFYRDILGFPVTFSNRLFVELEPAAGAHIGLLDATQIRRATVHHNSYILSFCVSDVHKTHALLRTRYTGLSEVRDHPWGAQLFELEDPEGRRLEFWSPSGSPS